MLNLNDLLNKEAQKVSKRFEDYTNLIYGQAKIGKSTLNAELFKDNGFFIFAEPRFKHLEGIKVEQVSNWSEFMQLVTLFKKNKKQLLPVYPNIIISGLENLLEWCKVYTLNHFGVNELGEVAYGQAHSFYSDQWNKFIKMLSVEGYKVHFELHATTETIKIPAEEITDDLKGLEVKTDKKTGVRYVEYDRVAPSMKTKFLNAITNNVDNILYCGISVGENGEDKRSIFLRGNRYHVAGLTFEGQVPELIDLDSKVLKETFEKVIGGYENTIEEEEKKVEIPFEDIVREISEIGKKMCQEGKREELTNIIEEYLGDRKVAEATEKDYEQCSLILATLKGVM